MLPLSCPSGLFPEGDALSQVLSQDKLVHICSRLMSCVAFQKILTSPRGRASHFGATSRAGGHCSLPPVPWCLSCLCLLCQRGPRRDLVCRFLLGKTEVEVGRRAEEEARSLTSQRDAGCARAVSLPGAVSTALLGETDFMLPPVRGSPAASEESQFLGAASGATNNLLFTMGTPL